jgi:uncharacterized membrane protein YhfC
VAEFENIVIGKSSIPALSITIILFIVISVGFFIYWYMKNKQQINISYLVAGILGFYISARVLELGVHYFCIIMDNPVSRFITGNTAAYVLYGVTMAGVFEECGRHIVLKCIMKKNRTPENSVLYGIGHGGIEILAVILPSLITCLVVAVMFSTGPIDVALKALNITEETASAALPVVQSAATFGYGMMVMNVIERVFAMLLHISLTVIVFYGVVSGRKRYLPLAILIHMLMDTFATLYQRGVVPLWSAEVWAGFWALVSGFIAVRLYRKMKERENV